MINKIKKDNKIYKQYLTDTAELLQQKEQPDYNKKLEQYIKKYEKYKNKKNKKVSVQTIPKNINWYQITPDGKWEVKNIDWQEKIKSSENNILDVTDQELKTAKIALNTNITDTSKIQLYNTITGEKITPDEIKDTRKIYINKLTELQEIRNKNQKKQEEQIAQQTTEKQINNAPVKEVQNDK